MLISDYLVRFDLASDGIDLPKKCFTRFDMNSALEALEQLAKAHDAESSSENNGELTERVWDMNREKCPYCNVPISMNGLYKSKCSNGHWYTRCGLTLQACKLRTYRGCIGCERKVSSKDTSGKLTIESILLNIDSCPFCGCRLIECYR